MGSDDSTEADEAVETPALATVVVTEVHIEAESESDASAVPPTPTATAEPTRQQTREHERDATEGTNRGGGEDEEQASPTPQETATRVPGEADIGEVKLTVTAAHETDQPGGEDRDAPQVEPTAPPSQESGEEETAKPRGEHVEQPATPSATPQESAEALQAQDGERHDDRAVAGEATEQVQEAIPPSRGSRWATGTVSRRQARGSAPKATARQTRTTAPSAEADEQGRGKLSRPFFCALVLDVSERMGL